MRSVGESEAKAIVKRDLRKWNSTLSEFLNARKTLFSEAKGITSVEKREKLIRQKFKKYGPNIFFKEVSFECSNNIVVAGMVDSTEEKINEISVSKSKRQARAKNLQKMNQHSQKINSNKTHVFVVNNNYSNGELCIFIHVPDPKDGCEERLLETYSIATITKHCLQRIIQRLNLENIYDAIDEIIASVIWLEGSGNELAGRQPGSYGDGIKRHIPTPNGALLLNTSSIESMRDKPTQECTLITWIHKSQFKIGQEVTKSDFIFVQMVNYFLSDPKLEQRINDFKKDVERLESNENIVKIVIKIHSEEYPAHEFISALEKGSYLDFIIDFEKPRK